MCTTYTQRRWSTITGADKVSWPALVQKVVLFTKAALFCHTCPIATYLRNNRSLLLLTSLHYLLLLLQLGRCTACCSSLCCIAISKHRVLLRDCCSRAHSSDLA